MRRFTFIFASGLLSFTLASSAFASGDDLSTGVPLSCGNGVPGGINCVATKKEKKEAREAFARGLKLQEHKKVEEAYTQFDEAMRLVPQNPQFVSARELAKAQLVYNHIERGNVLLLEDSRVRAAAEFRAAIELDPDNDFARSRLQEASREWEPAVAAVLPAKLQDAGEIQIEPKSDRATFHFRGDVRGLFEELGNAYGVKAQFDDSVQARQVRFYVDDVDFFTALRLASQVSKTMWSPLDSHQLLVAADNPENHKQFDRMSLQTFILPSHSTPQEVTDLVTTMRNMFDLKFVSSGQTSGTVEVRAPLHMLEACDQLLAQLSSERPQVMVDVRVFQINHQLTRNIGVHIPNTFTMYNIPAVAIAGLAGLGGQNIQSLINQLISSGGINQAGSSALSGLLAQLGGQQNSIFSTPLATFGGGISLMGISLDQFTAQLSLNESWVRSLENMSLRAGQGSETTFHIGERYPIINASYSPIANSAAISQVLGNQSYVAPFPSVSYEDLGLNVKAKPTIHSNGDVSLQLELQVRSLTGESNNGVPVISNREYKGSINLKDGEPAVVAGQVSKTDTRSMSGIPGLGYLPILNQAMVTNTKEEEDDELMIVLTPHVLANSNRTTPEIWMTGK
jgi:hypothetical protein